MGSNRTVKTYTLCLVVALIVLSQTIQLASSSYEYKGVIEVYTFPQDSHDAINRIVELINDAQAYVHVAAYMVESKDIAQALVKAYRRGVDVKVVSDLDTLGESGSQIYYLKNNGIPVRLDNRNGDYMHDKFIIIDGEIVITGSTNFNPNSFKLYNNDLVIIHNTKLAQIYEEEFNELFRGLFGKGQPTVEHNVTVDDTLIEVYFTPEDNAKDRLIQLINNAKKSIYFAVFVFTNHDIADALVKAAARGVVVLGVMEEYQLNNIPTMRQIYDYLRANDVGVARDQNPYIMHCKLFIIDNKTVITGSFNPTNHAIYSNDENLIIIHNPEIAKYYASWFLKTLFPQVIQVKVKVVDPSGNPIEGAVVTITNLDKHVSFTGITDSEGTWIKVAPTWSQGDRVRIYVSYGFPFASTATQMITLKNGLNEVTITIAENTQQYIILIAIAVIAIAVPIVYKLYFKKKKR